MVTVYSSDQFSYPFYSEDNSGYVVTYRSDGLYLGSSDQDDRDLVAEYTPSSDNISGNVIGALARGCEGFLVCA